MIKLKVDMSQVLPINERRLVSIDIAIKALEQCQEFKDVWLTMCSQLLEECDDKGLCKITSTREQVSEMQKVFEIKPVK
jgi:hypothetical protein